MNGEREQLVRDAVSDWLDRAGLQQKELADRLGVAPPSLNKMLKGTSPFPLPRFLQTAYILSPGEAEINRVFALYLAELKIPAAAMRLIVGHPPAADAVTIRQRIHALVDRLPDNRLAALEPLLQTMTAQAE